LGGCGGQLDKLGSRELTFKPGEIEAGDYEFRINTAGATAWLEGWGLPVEKAIQDVLTLDAASPSC
jgi:hypothetical protein